MKHYGELANLQVFNKEDINNVVGNSNAAKMILKNYVRSGLIQKIKFNYYATYSIENHQPIASRFIIDSNVNEKAYISHHTAFEYYGLRNQVFNTVYVSSGKSFKEFEYDGITYIPVKAKSDRCVDRMPNIIKEHIICDCLRQENKMDAEIYNKAIQAYVKDPQKNIPRLMEYAKILRTENKLSKVIAIWL